MIDEKPRRGRPRSAGAAAAAALLLACGARTPLSTDGGAEHDGTGGATGRTSSGATSTGTGASGGGLDCVLDDFSTWNAERHRDDGDYERAAAATSGVPWVALKVRGGNIVLERLAIDDTGIVVLETFELPNSPVYPVALDVSDTRFVVLTTTGINWNGDVELWSVDRDSGVVLRAPIGDPPADPAYTVGSALGLVGDDVVLAYSRLIDDQGTVELRDAQLQVVDSWLVRSVSFQVVRGLGEGLDVYLGAVSRLHFEGRTATEEPVDPSWHILGGLEDHLVQYSDEIRLIDGDQIWSGPWPHTQISPPAVVRKSDQRVAFSLETELTAVVGYRGEAGLEWMEIEGAPGASGMGVGLMPVLQEGRMGLIYLGLEIPMPEQPLRYFGRVCR